MEALDPQIAMKMWPTIQQTLLHQVQGTWMHHAFRACRTFKRQVRRRVDGERILLRQYHALHGRPLDRTNPRTFTQKLFCRMLAWNRGHDPLFTQLTDKYAVRAYVQRTVGEQYLPALLWQGDDPHAIPFDALPAAYVIKTNHGSGHVMLVRGTIDRRHAIAGLSNWLQHNFYWVCREAQYYDIEPRIMIEEYLGNQDGSELLNYKFWCFAGVPEIIHISNATSDIHSFFDVHWNHLDLIYREGARQTAVAKPQNFEQMLSIASQLSAGFDFVRVDLYNVDGKVYFSELTFTPMAGALTFRPASWNLTLGEKWTMSPPHQPADQGAVNPKTHAMTKIRQ